MENGKYCVVLTTFSDDAVGKSIINTLLEKHLAACIQVQNIESYYHWKGKVENDSEKLAVIKTTSACYEQVENEILRLHNYETPEIVRLPVSGGFAGYLRWIDEACPDPD